MWLSHWRYQLVKAVQSSRSNHQKVPALLALKRKLADKLFFQNAPGSGRRIRLLISGGAALPEELGYIYLGAGLPIVQGYGLTETSPVITAGRVEDNRVGTVGKPIRNVEVRIASDGEIETRGPHVMRGYYNKPAETLHCFTAMVVQTGDIGTLDEIILRINDRKRTIKTSGEIHRAPAKSALVSRARSLSIRVLIGRAPEVSGAL